MQYYEVTWRDDGDSHAAVPRGHDRATANRISKPGLIEPFPELEWEWNSPDHPPGDIVMAVDGVRLVSPLVKAIFESHRSSDDVIQWLPATIVDASNARLPYWTPHFPVHHDLLDAENSAFAPSGRVIRYSFARDKLATHAVTVRPGSFFSFILAHQVVAALDEAGATGYMVMRAPVS